MKCHQCQKKLKPPVAICAVCANLDEWPRVSVYWASYLEGDPEPRRPVCDMFFALCSPACAAVWWGYVHQVMQDKLERHESIKSPAEVLRVH